MTPRDTPEAINPGHQLEASAHQLNCAEELERILPKKVRGHLDQRYGLTGLVERQCVLPPPATAVWARPTRAPAGRPAGHTTLDPEATDTVTGPDIATSRPNLRRVILTDPWRAAAYLHRLTDPTIGGTPGPAHRVDAIILTAEAHTRLRDHDAAIVCARNGLRAARQLQPTDPRRLTAVLGVLADIAVSTGAPKALDMCLDYIEAACAGPSADYQSSDHRVVLGTALFAVGSYHTNCGHGRDLITGVLDLHRSRTLPDSGATMIEAALTTMNDICGGQRQAPATDRPPPPFPGGLLHQALDEPPPDYLVDRVHAQTARHTCPAHTPATTENQSHYRKRGMFA